MEPATRPTQLLIEAPWAILCGTKRRTPDSGAALLRRQARESVCKFFYERTHSRKLALECAVMLHGPVCAFEASLRRIKARQLRSGLEYQRLPVGNAAVAALKRLQRNAAKGGYHWAKAWLELPPAAFEAILAAAEKPFSIPIGVAPEPDLIVPLLPTARQVASSPKYRTCERDAAVVAILRVYRTLRRRKPTNPKSQDSDTLKFIEKIETLYASLLPKGFGVSRSKGTLHRLIKLAAED